MCKMILYQFAPLCFKGVFLSHYMKVAAGSLTATGSGKLAAHAQLSKFIFMGVLDTANHTHSSVLRTPTEENRVSWACRATCLFPVAGKELIATWMWRDEDTHLIFTIFKISACSRWIETWWCAAYRAQILLFKQLLILPVWLGGRGGGGGGFHNSKIFKSYKSKSLNHTKQDSKAESRNYFSYHAQFFCCCQFHTNLAANRLQAMFKYRSGPTTTVKTLRYPMLIHVLFKAVRNDIISHLVMQLQAIGL